MSKGSISKKKNPTPEKGIRKNEKEEEEEEEKRLNHGSGMEGIRWSKQSFDYGHTGRGGGGGGEEEEEKFLSYWQISY
jgi:hypothetical protein